MKLNKTFFLETYDEANLITEAFGIESGYKKEVFNIELPDVLPQIIYITGESGCGKSTLLKEMIKDYDLPTHTLNIDETTPLFLWGDNKEENLRLLSLVGLSDATLFISKWNELSDSQQYRATLYKYLLSDSKYIILDEFLSTLDRKTAQAVSYVFQKAIRKTNKILICSTAHSDLKDYLQPDLTIEGRAFVNDWTITERIKSVRNPYLLNTYVIHENKEWYRETKLGELHYKGKYTGGVKDYLALYLRQPIGQHDILVGLLIGTYRMSDGGRRISRVVIHPSYRSCGLGVLLVKKYAEMHPTVDVVASMALYNPVFEKAGLLRQPDSVYNPPAKLKKAIVANAFDVKQWHSKTYCNDYMKYIENRIILSNHAKEISYLVCPGGKYVDKQEVIDTIMNNPKTAGRVLWNIRPKKLGKFKNEG